MERELISKNSVAFLANEEVLFYIFILFKNRWFLFHLLIYKNLEKQYSHHYKKKTAENAANT
jgi:hypothetical protein